MVQTEMTVADGERFAAIVWQTYAKYFNVTVEPLNQRKAEPAPLEFGYLDRMMLIPSPLTK